MYPLCLNLRILVAQNDFTALQLSMLDINYAYNTGYIYAHVRRMKRAFIQIQSV